MRLFSLSLLLVAMGCGGNSTADLIERAAARRRPPEPATAATAAPPPAADDITAKPAAASPDAAASSTPPAASSAAAGAPAASGAAAVASRSVIPGKPGDAGIEPRAAAALLPVAQRRPTRPLDESQRRQRALQNIQRIGQALQQYVADRKLLPARGSLASGGMLSWRVELLPYLGYQQLYDRFDPGQPWNGPTNLPLLQQIPDEYASPERFDEKTNYLGVAGRSYAFDDRPVRVSRVEDGLANTIVIVEVEDASAVPWTKPDDYAPPFEQLQQGIRGLRGDGNYALWGNGWPTLLATTLTQQQLHNAFTVDAGDGQVAAAIEQPIEIDAVADPLGADPLAENVDATTPRMATSLAQPATDASQRAPVPPAIQLEAASAKLRELYGEQIDATRQPAQLSQLAGQLLQQATQMTSDPVGAFALLSAVEQLAIQAGDVSLAVEAVDARIVAFDVEPYRANADLLQALASADIGRTRRTVDAAPLVERAVRVIHAALQREDYATASKVADATAESLAGSPAKSLAVLTNRLRTQLSVARGYYTRLGSAVDRLRTGTASPQQSANVGMYLCFIKGDWQQGLDLLAQGSSQPLAAAAGHDLAQPESPAEMLSVADAWWQLSEQATHDIYRQACQERAVHWYRQAHALLPASLDKLHAQRRIDSADSSPAGTPAASLAALAEQFGIDLQQDLLTVATERRSSAAHLNSPSRTR